MIFSYPSNSATTCCALMDFSSLDFTICAQIVCATHKHKRIKIMTRNKVRQKKNIASSLIDLMHSYRNDEIENRDEHVAEAGSKSSFTWKYISIVHEWRIIIGTDITRIQNISGAIFFFLYFHLTHNINYIIWNVMILIRFPLCYYVICFDI